MRTTLVVICLVAASLAAAYRLNQEANSDFGSARVPSIESQLSEYKPDELRTEIEAFCSRCHPFPDPGLYPEGRWPDEINRAMNFHKASGDEDPDVDAKVILAWFRSRAKPKPPLTNPITIVQNQVFGSSVEGPNLGHAAAVSCLLPTVIDGRTYIVSTDMISGKIQQTDPETTEVQTLAILNYPSRIRSCDLDPECEEEFLVSELGTPGANDELVGRVIWLHKNSSEASEEFETTILAEGFGRVADIRSADFDSDGDEDIVVAEFGWDKVGSVQLLENVKGEFTKHELDARHGAVELNIVDFDGDGRLDFLAAFGQELESVELFRNVGNAKFESRELFSAATPAFGMSSLSVYDSDGDGDLDVLFTAGDMYDSFFPQDHHGVYLLTNNGDGEFPVTTIGYQPATMSARAGDVDGDGDIDIVAGSFIPMRAGPYPEAKGYAGLVLYRQVEPGRFESCPMKAGDCVHAAIELVDLDADGDLDLVTGTLHDTGGVAETGIHWWPNNSQAAANASQ